MKNNIDLVKHAHALIGSPYLWGTIGRIVTKSSLLTLFKQYPDYYNQDNRKARALANAVGKIGVDCCGLIKAYMFTEAVGKPVGKVPNDLFERYDVNVGGLIKRCSVTGPINTLPEVPGILLFQGTHHVGVYAGNGKAIEAKGFDYGVVETDVHRVPWDRWGKLSWISYPASVKSTPSKTQTTKKPYNVQINISFVRVRQTPNGALVHPLKNITKGQVVSVSDVEKDAKLRKWGKTKDGWIALWLTKSV